MVMQNNVGFEPTDLSEIQMWNEIDESTECVSQRIPNTFSRGNVKFLLTIFDENDRTNI